MENRGDIHFGVVANRMGRYSMKVRVETMLLVEKAETATIDADETTDTTTTSVNKESLCMIRQ
jgi:hypothetical protein